MVFYARALCRRAERSLVKLEIGDWRLEILAYINRLSDYLFTMARSINFEEKVEEKFWKT
jgi:cob(I)alamin adenosyltransferase